MAKRHQSMRVVQFDTELYQDGSEQDLAYEFALAANNLDKAEYTKLKCAYEIAKELNKLEPDFLESEMKPFYMRMHK